MRHPAEANLSALIESTDDLIWSVDVDYRLVLFNQALKLHIQRSFGITATEGMDLKDLLPAEEAALWPPLYDRALAGEAFRTDFPISGGRTLELAFNPIVVEGEAAGVSVFGKDISERKNTERTLQEADRKYREIFDGALEGIFQTSPDARVLTANRAMAEMLGYDSPDELKARVGDVRTDIWADPVEHARFSRQIECHGSVKGFEYRLKRKNGEVFWGSLTCRQVRAADGRLAYFEGFVKDISERKAAETALMAAEKQFRNIFDGALEGIFQTTLEGRFLAANQAMARMLGYDSPEEMVSTVIDSAHCVWVNAEERSVFQWHLGERLVMRGYECQFRRKDGTRVWVSLNCRRTLAADGKTFINEGFIEDITARKQAESALRESMASLNETQKISALGSYVTDFTTGVWTSSEAMDEIFGIDETFSRTVAGWTALIHPDDRATMAAYLADEVLGRKQPFDKEYRIVRATDQAVRWVHGLGRLELGVEGRAVKMTGIIRDITTRKQEALALEESEARFRRFFEDNCSVMMLVDPESGNIFAANRAAAAYYGYSREQLLGMSAEQIHMLPKEGIEQERRRIMDEGGASCTLRDRLASGEVRDVEVYASPMTVDGRLLVFSIVHDVTERRQIETQLRDSEERFRATFEQAAIGIVHTSFEGRFLRCNRRYAEIVGYPMEEIPGLSFEQVTLPEDRAESHQTHMRMVAAETGTISFEKRYLRKDGGTTWATLTLSQQRDGQGRLLHTVGFAEDITKRKLAEMQLRDSEERYRIVFQTSSDSVVISRMSDGVILDANRAFLDSSGFSREEVLGRSVRDLAIWANDEDLSAFASRLNQKGGCKDFEVQSRRKNGELFWMRLSASLIEVGGDHCRVTFAKEITEMKAVEERMTAAQNALQVSEARYRTAFQTSLDVINITRIDDGTYLEVNEAFLDLTGFQRDEVVGRTSSELGIWADAAERDKLIEILRVHSSCRDFKSQFRKKNGAIIWGLMSASKFELDGIPCLLTVTRDVTVAKAAEEHLAAAQVALELSEARYRTTFETSLDAIMLARLDTGAFLDVNQSFLDFSGYQRHEVIGKSSLDLNFWADPRDRERLFEVIRTESICRNIDVRFRKKSGELVWGRLTALVVDIDGVSCTASTVRDITAAKASEERLTAATEAMRLSEAHYRSVFQTSVDCISVSQMTDGRYIDVNKAFLDVMGYEREEVVGRTSVELNFWANPDVRQAMVDTLRQESNLRDAMTQFRTKSGALIWVLISASTLEIEGVPCILSVMRDVTATKATEERLAVAQMAQRATEARYHVAFETSLDAVNINRLSDGMLIDCNQAFLDIMGYDRHEVIGRTSLERDTWANPADRERLLEMLRRDGNCKCLDAQFRKKNGELLWGQMSASIMEVDGVPCILSITRDVSAAKVAEEEIRSLAFYDTLTQLPNRRLVSDRLRQTLAASARSKHKAALLFIDLDDFKTLNDTLGHNTGDLMLQEVARRLIGCIREVDTVARLGGDEFVVILEELSGDAEHAATQAKNVAEKILVTLGQPYFLDGRECLSTSSVGITVFEDSEESIDGLLQQADIAMYQAKAAGRNTLHFFAPALQTAINTRAALEGDLRRAIQKHQFVLFFQPQVDCCHLIGAEALVRWKHPSRGLLAPGEFIALAEESGLILQLGNWVLETACAQIAKWALNEATAQISVSVNISARQFRQPDFVDQVLKALETTGADPHKLELELTESMLVDNIEDVTAKMTQLKAHGLRFSLDDFGTGYSSLAYLKRLPLTQLKIDRSFVRDILADASSRAIAQAVISLGRALGLGVIAEGVETEDQRDLLDSLGCHSFQGYLFSRPVKLEEFEEWGRKFVETAAPCGEEIKDNKGPVVVGTSCK